MSAATRVLAISVLALGLAPALAHACDDDATAKATATATATVTTIVTPEVKCVVKVATECKAKNAFVYKFTCDEKTSNAVAESGKDKDDPDSKAVNTEGRRPSGWEPGHLIEPDSMKLQQENQNPQSEQWVKISSRGNKIKFHKTQSSKKTQSRILQQYGPYRVVLNPQLP